MSIFRPRTFLLAALGALALTGAVSAGTYSNSNMILIPPFGSAQVSHVDVTNEAQISKLTVTLNGFSHQQPDDVDILLVAPGGQQVVLMSDAGSNNVVGGLTLTFDDAAPDPVTDEGALSDGTYQTSNYGPSVVCPGEADPDSFPGAPAGTLGSDLSAFNGTDPNGTWSLYIVDDCNGFDGQVLTGWSIDINPITSAVGVAKFAAKPRRGQIALTWRTGEESNTLGFEVLRSSGHKTVRLNSKLIGAHHRGTGLGSAYRFVDHSVHSGVSYTYRLVRVGLDGSRSRVGAVALRAS
jgi:subtilisin-like proprotein convertase family protein